MCNEIITCQQFAGGLFSKLEAQWKAVNIPPPKPSNSVFRYVLSLWEFLTEKLNSVDATVTRKNVSQVPTYYAAARLELCSPNSDV